MVLVATFYNPVTCKIFPSSSNNSDCSDGLKFYFMKANLNGFLNFMVILNFLEYTCKSFSCLTNCSWLSPTLMGKWFPGTKT